MKQKILILTAALLLPLSWVAGQEKDKAAKAVPDSVTVVRDTVYLNSAQYALDSLKYASQVELEKVRSERYKDSIVYARMSADRLYNIQMARQSRYWQPPFERFMNGGGFAALLTSICLMLALWFVLQAREKGKQRAHQLRMAQFEAMQKEKIISRGQQKDDVAAQENIRQDIPDPVFRPERTNYAQIYEQGRDSLADYLKKPSKYRRTGIIFMLIGLGVMMFFLSLGSNTPWGLGIIPMFIGFAYLYLDYSNAKSVEERKQMEEFLRYKRERESRQWREKGGASADDNGKESAEEEE